ncbi:MAG: phospho-sugar mutase [Clostridiales bacterium]|nr:phospho-sugar mutase [Clostridiales bacterium]
MRFRNTLTLLTENFKNVSRVLVYKLVVGVICAALYGVLILPQLVEIFSSVEWNNLLGDIRTLLAEFMPGHASGSTFEGLRDEIVNESLPAFGGLVWTMAGEIIGRAVACIIVYLGQRFLDTLCYFSVGSIINDRMTTYAETPFRQAYVANLGKASKYALVYVPVAFAIDLVMLAIVAVICIFVNVGLSLFLSMTVIAVGQAVKLTFTSAWMPAITADNMSLKEAIHAVRESEKRHHRKAFSLYLALVYIIVAINAIAIVFTFLSGLLITIPMSYVLLICAQYVNYFTIKGKKYFVTFDDIATNECKGDTEHFFDYVDETAQSDEPPHTEPENNENNKNGDKTMEYQKNYEAWLHDERLCEEGKQELLSIASDEKEKEYRFAAEPEFGTAGMRGLIGYGMNMMNIYTVMRATQGLAEFIKTLGAEAMARGVVISYDTRRKSEEFARVTAEVLAKNGIKAYLFDDVHPVPMLSYAVRYLKTVAGVMITASHNPKEYNGYKVYGEDGAQMSPEDTAKVVAHISKIEDFLSVSGEKNSPLILPVPAKLDEDYIEELSALTLSKEAVEKCGASLKLVYTPVHGSGYKPVMAILQKLGINVTVVEEQAKKDTEFSTVKVPNPEYKETMSMGIALANEIQADVVFGTDPDADRLGVVVRDNEGEFVALSGNQVGILLLDYILQRLSEDGVMPANAAVVKSFVSTGMAKALCEDYGVALYETPVGFKFIGEKIKQWEADGKHTYVFGFEESCGYLRGTHARDKDAVVASMLCAEMVCYYSYVGKSVYARLQEIYAKYGYVLDKNVSIQYSGLNAMKEMNGVVDALKTMDVKNLGEWTVEAFRDYSADVRKDYLAGTVVPLNIPKCNCVYYELSGGSFVCVRPSGTEPKLKIYYSLKAATQAQAEEDLVALQAAVSEMLEKAKN